MLKISVFYLLRTNKKVLFLFLKYEVYHVPWIVLLWPTDAVLSRNSPSIYGSGSLYLVSNNKSCVSAAQYIADLN